MRALGFAGALSALAGLIYVLRTGRRGQPPPHDEGDLVHIHTDLP